MTGLLHRGFMNRGVMNCGVMHRGVADPRNLAVSASAVTPGKPVKRGSLNSGESGYALLILIFFVALMLVAASTVGLKVVTQGQREKEMELEWRGKQYVRGVKLYSRKNGRFPKSIEDLVKPGVGVRFMRKEYKDPVNTADGSWRLIYVGPAGQLMGSVKAGGHVGLFPGIAGAGVKPVVAGATPAGSISGLTEGSASDPGFSARRSEKFEIMSSTPKPSEDDPFGAKSIASGVGSDGKIIGGNIIGVASKIDKRSIRVYEGGETYREWEFIYDPSKDRGIIGQPGMHLGNPAGGLGNNPNQNRNQNPNSDFPFRRGRRPPRR